MSPADLRKTSLAVRLAMALSMPAMAQVGTHGPAPALRVEGRSVIVPGTIHPTRWRWHPLRYGGHHALVYGEGKMAGKACLRTPVPDETVAAALAGLGLDSAGGISRQAWELRRDAGSQAADQRAQGSRLRVLVRWEGSGGFRSLDAMLEDRNGHLMDLRFVDNRSWITVFESGCIVCLASCPGGKIANRGLTIRENEAGAADFRSLGDDLPRDGAAVEIRIEAVDRAAGDGPER